MSQRSTFSAPDPRFQNSRSPFAMSDVRGASGVAIQGGSSRSNTEMDLSQVQGDGALSRVGQPGQPDYLEELGPIEQVQVPPIRPMATNRTPMTDFISGVQAPWTPPVILTDAQRGSKGALNHRFQAPNGALMNYRSQTVPSEADTSVHGGVPRSDSGFYGSNPPRSSLPSAYDDGNTDTQSLTGHFQEFNFPGTNHGLSPGTDAASQPPPQWGIGASQSGMSPPPVKSGLNRFPCPDPGCDHESKTKSEFNKHLARHTRPHRCKVPGCTHQSGFSTSNDLDRHKRSRHPEVMSGGNSFRCREGNCAGKKKIWPRADNFRSHLKRVHKKEFKREDELDNYLYNPNETPPHILAGLASSSGYPFPGGIGSDAITPAMLHIRPETLGQGFAMDGGGSQVGDAMGYTGFLNTFAYSGSQSLDLSPRGEMPLPSRLPLGPLPELHETHEIADDISQVESTHTEAWESGAQQEQLSYASATPQVDMSVEEDSSARVGEGASHMEVDDQDSEMGGEAETEAVPIPNREQVVENEPGLETQGGERREPSNSTSSSDGPGDESPTKTSSPQLVQEKASSQETPPSESVPEQHQEPEDENGSESETTSSTEDGGAHIESAKAVDGEDHQSADSDPPVAETDVKALLMEQFKLDDEDSVMEMMRQIQENGILDKVVGKLGYQKAKLPSARSAKKSNNGQSQSGGLVPQKCNRCLKEFKRPCELKKHQKRHDKPYGCTRCNQRFGSKNDWKRHETGQHPQLEIWNCREKLGSSGSKDAAMTTCQRIYHHRETFRSHLQKDHKLAETKVLDSKLEKCKLGKDGDARFWCGFCTKLVGPAEPSNSSGGAASTVAAGEDSARGQRRLDRFDHIDDHYCGRNGFTRIDRREWREPDALELPPSAAGAGSPESGVDKGKGKDEKGQGRADLNSKWFCCQCHNYWDIGASSCMDSECGHTQCHDCVEGQLPTNWKDPAHGGG